MRRPRDFTIWTSHHGGVFTRKTARSLGISSRRFRTGVGRGEWVPFRGLWRLTDFPLTYHSEVWAALLKAGPDARITAHSTLVTRGLQLENPPVVVVIPSTRRIDVPGAIVLRDKCPEPMTQTINGFPSVPRTRAIIDALRIGTPTTARDILHEVLRQDWIRPEDLVTACDELSGHRGLGQLRRLTVYANIGSQAESERRLVNLLTRSRIQDGWEFNHRLHDRHGKLIAIADAVHLPSQTVVEIDGRAWHTDYDRFQRDRTRQNALFLAGWRVLRFTWEDLVHRRQEVLATIRKCLTLPPLNAATRTITMVETEPTPQDGKKVSVSDHFPPP